MVTTEAMTRASFLESSSWCVTASLLQSSLRPTMSFRSSLTSWCPAFSFAARCLFSRHRLPSQTPLPRLNWALPPLETVVMVNMTDPIVDRTVHQLNGYGLYDYVRESYSRYLFADGPSSLLGYCEVEFTTVMTVLCHPALSFELQCALF